jgi:hypothetical protein
VSWQPTATTVADSCNKNGINGSACPSAVGTVGGSLETAISIFISFGLFPVNQLCIWPFPWLLVFMAF